MSIIAASTVRAAREHLDQYGLRRDGAWGAPGEACCTIGAIALAWTAADADLDHPDFDLDSPADYVSENVADAWKRWMAAEQGFSIDAEAEPLAERLIDWNDGDASDDEVRRFYDWWATDLTTAGLGDAR